jgi:hypothetical protein
MLWGGSLNKFYRVMWSAGATIFWGGLAVGIPFWIFFTTVIASCQFDEYSKFVSPDQSIRAVVVIADCGASTDWQTQIYAEKLDGSFKTTNLIRLKGHPKDIDFKIDWSENKKLIISDFEFDKMLGINKQGWGGVLKVEFKVKTSQIAPVR